VSNRLKKACIYMEHACIATYSYMYIHAARCICMELDIVDGRTCPAVILILSPLGTQTWIEEQDSEERGGLNVSGLCNRSIWSQKYKTKSIWCGPLPRSNKTLATLVLSIQEGNF